MKTPAELIRAEILAQGPLAFARFMEIALYAPQTGYYERQRENVGRAGDFYTSVSTGELFGELLAFQFANWLSELPKNGQCPVQIVEAGAHDAKLARDILSWLRSHRPELFSRLEYCVLEPSPVRQSWQQETLKDFANVRWIDAPLATLPGRFNGVLFGNELLDAFPVHRYGWDAAAKKWFEWAVTLDGEAFVWTKLSDPQPVSVSDSHFALRASYLESISDLPSSVPSSNFALRTSPFELPSALLAVLPNNYTIETSPAAEAWWRDAAGALAQGRLMALDYGFTADDLISPGRTRGTLRAYSRHHVGDDLLAHVGEQDLTAHVNFSAIQAAGEAAGLQTRSFSTQTRFLTRILEQTLADPAKTFGDWTPRRARQFQTLTHPEHLGRAFQVLVQSK